MAILYVRSTDGNDADSGLTWALALAKFTGAAAIDTAGDTIFVSQVHAETTASAINFAWAGTLAAPTRVICGNDAAEPPTAVATTATVSTTGAANLTTQGTGVYCYGITYSCGSTTNNALISLANVNSSWHRYEQCQFILAANNAANPIRLGLSSGTNIRIDWKNCNIKLINASQGLQVMSAFHWNGGGIISGSTSPTALVILYNAAAASSALIENVDLSNFSAGVNLSVAPPQAARSVFRNCKLPASWSGSPLSGSFTLPGRIEMYNCDSGSTNYKLWIEDFAGSIRDETTFVRSGGASDGTTPISWKMVSNANALYPLTPLASSDIVLWNDTTGSSKTLTVEILRDSATNLKDNEVWLDVSYIGSGSTLGVPISDAVADVLATAADQAGSSVTWVTSGMSNANKQALAVTFTPQKKGFFIARVMLAKASTTIYVDPKLTVT